MTNLFGVAARQGLCGAILKADTRKRFDGQAVSQVELFLVAAFRD